MITERTLAPRGTHATCWLRGDTLYVAYQDVGGKLVMARYRVVASGALGEEWLLVFHLGPDAGAYPVFGEHTGRVLLAYRLGAPSYAGVVIDADTSEEIGRTYRLDGINPLAMSGGHVYALRVVDGAWRIERSPIDRIGEWEGRWPATGQGISRIVDGSPILIDDDRTREPGMTLPSYSGDLVAGEHPTAGVIVRRVR